MKSDYITKVLLALLVSFALISSIASASDFVYKQNTFLDMKVPCVNDGAACSNLANCSLTIQNPDGSQLVKDVLMTNQGSFHNYTLGSSQTSVLGTYQAQVFCVDSGMNGWQSFSYDITTTGTAYSSIFQNPLILSLIGLSIIIFIIAIVLRNLYLSFISGGAFLLTGIYVLINGLGQVSDLYTRGLGMIALGMGIYLSVGSAYDLVEHEGGNDSMSPDDFED